MSKFYYGVVYYNDETEQEYYAHLIAECYSHAEKRAKASIPPKGFEYWHTLYLIDVKLADKIGQRDEYGKIIRADSVDFDKYMENKVREK